MTAQDLISYEIQSIDLSSDLKQALQLMEENRCEHLALIENDVYKGLLSEADILDLEEQGKSIREMSSELIKPFVNFHAHIYQVISTVNEFSISCIPVLNDENKFLGVISLQNLAFSFAKLTNVNEPGGILVLEVQNKDYSLAQAAQIVESDNGKILSSYVYGSRDRLTLNLVLKINKKDLSTIISAFERYNYLIKESYHESIFDEDTRGRYDQFMNYLNM